MEIDDSVFGSVVVMLLSSILAGAMWECQHDYKAGLLDRCYAMAGYNDAMRELYSGKWL